MNCEWLNIIDDTEIDFYGFHSRHELLVFDPGHVKQPLAGDGAALGAVLVREVDHGLDARLDDHLGALVAGEERHVYRAARHVLGVLVEDGVHLGVADVHVLVVQPAVRTESVRASWAGKHNGI